MYSSMKPLVSLLLGLQLLNDEVCAKQWPYNRHLGLPQKSGHYKPDKDAPEFATKPSNQFWEWFGRIVDKDQTLRSTFPDGRVPDSLHSLHEYVNNLAPPNNTQHHLGPEPYRPIPNVGHYEANRLFGHLGFPLDSNCTDDQSKWWYRTYDGSCNWLKMGEASVGQAGTAKSRDYEQYTYADNISTPREGPNPRALSNAFFRRKKSLYYEHTPLLLGLIEFLMHDVSYSEDSPNEHVVVAMPEDETVFPLNTTFRVSRTAAVPGTGTSPENKRENINMATTWMDLSALYGSRAEVARPLRSFQGGKLLTQSLKAEGEQRSATYLPWNTMRVATRSPPHIDPETLFAGGDARTNEDWILLAFHTLLLREHNRLCDILAARRPDFDDEQIYQTVRLLMSAKMNMIANAYQMAYWTDDMPWPRDDGFPLFRAIKGEEALQINPAHVYPWPLVTKGGKPMTVSAEMAVVYRFHEFIIPDFPIKDEKNRTLWDQNLFSTGFDAEGFAKVGLEKVLRGMLATTIPNFKSGVDEAFRSAGLYRGRPFDVATWSIVHEREQGLPTFNQYFRGYNAQDPHVVVPIRATFEDFSTDPEAVAQLRRLYSDPDDVDLVVGVQLDESYFPGTTIPTSAAITSLFSLFAAGNADRFGVGFAVMRCWLVDKPWDCHPSNALEELLWKPHPRPGYPHMRFYDDFWMAELDLPSHGNNLLWRLVTENTAIKCLQKRPLFPVDADRNPVMCELEEAEFDLYGNLFTLAQVCFMLVKLRKWECLCGFLLLVFPFLFLRKRVQRR